MSSHHIVRAKQEPALIILSLERFDTELLGQLLEWSPTVLVAASAYEAVESLGIKIDVVAGPVEAMQGNLTQLDEAVDYLSATVSYLIAEGYPAVNIINDNIMDLPASHYAVMSIVWFCGNEKSICIKSGFSVWKPAGTYLCLSETKGVETSNLLLRKDSTFTVLEDGFISFIFDQPQLLLTEQL